MAIRKAFAFAVNAMLAVIVAAFVVMSAAPEAVSRQIHVKAKDR
jgi:hypothetical protein